MRLVCLETPFAGDTETNLRFLACCMRDCIRRNESPYASHALYTREGCLDDDKPEERELGIAAGLAWGDKAEARVVYTNLGVSAGMERGIAHASKIGQPVEMRELDEEQWPRPDALTELRRLAGSPSNGSATPRRSSSAAPTVVPVALLRQVEAERDRLQSLLDAATAAAVREPRERLPQTRDGKTGKFCFQGRPLDAVVLRDRYEKMLAFLDNESRQKVLPLLLDMARELFQPEDTRGYLYTGEYLDGRCGELFIVWDRAGTALRGFSDAVATHASMRLQRGETVAQVTEKMIGMRFEPAGPTGNKLVPRASSVLDFAAKWLRHHYPAPLVEVLPDVTEDVEVKS